jgi:hypothetical protein
MDLVFDGAEVQEFASTEAFFIPSSHVAGNKFMGRVKDLQNVLSLQLRPATEHEDDME